MHIDSLMYLVPAAGLLALAYAFVTTGWIGKQDAGTSTMKAISEQIHRGAMAFLAAEYKILAIFVMVVAGLLVLLNTTGETGGSPWIGVSFIVGASASGLAGFLGMRVATKANVRTASAARSGLSPALTVAFRGGAVMGMSVVGLALLGLGGLFIAYTGRFDAMANVEGAGGGAGLKTTVDLLAGFSMGASSIALFARVGGGIYTKAADVGADLVGKVEAGIPEDDPRNPATIADNVGDNVGDVAGMGADLFESYVGSIVGADDPRRVRFTASRRGSRHGAAAAGHRGGGHRGLDGVHLLRPHQGRRQPAGGARPRLVRGRGRGGRCCRTSSSTTSWDAARRRGLRSSSTARVRHDIDLASCRWSAVWPRAWRSG